MMPRTFSLLVILSLLGLVSSCGYRLGVDRPARLQHIKTIAVPTFKNDTLEPRIAVLATNSLIKRLQASSNYQVVDRKDADAILTGIVSSIDIRQSRGVRTDTISSRELEQRVFLEWYLQDAATGAVLDRGRTSERGVIVVGDRIQVAERQAQSEVFERSAFEIVSKISEGW